MVDKALGPKLGDCQKASSLDVALVAPIISALNVGHQRQAGEVVARQEPFSRQVAIQVEIIILVRLVREQD